MRCPFNFHSCSTTSHAPNPDLSALQHQVSQISDAVTGIKLALIARNSPGPMDDVPTSGAHPQPTASGSAEHGQTSEATDISSEEDPPVQPVSPQDMSYSSSYDFEDISDQPDLNCLHQTNQLL